MGVTATRSSTTEPMLVGDACAMLNFHSPRDRRDAMVLTRGDAFTSSCGAARNPDPKAQWPRKRNWNNSRPASWTVANTERLCTGSRQSKDVIVYLGQKTHSSYDATHANTLNASMASLRKYMKRIRDTDVIVWHEGDLTNEDANALDGATNVRFCLLRKETGWGRPPWLKKMPPSQFSAGYRFMIRFYAVTIWPTLDRLGYEWVMRMDDDSFFLSPVPYNIFEDMRRRGALYAYRTLSRECPVIFGDFVEDFVEYVSQTQRRLASMRQLLGPRRKQPGVSYKPWYCPGPGRLGFYNNWFVTKISWWLEDHRVAARAESSRRWRIIG